MARSASAVLVAALLLATGAAFAYTERLKLTPSPILGTAVTKVFSPVCDCSTDVAVISFSLRKADRVDVEIVDARDAVVRRLVVDGPRRKGRMKVVWNGRDETGAVVPEGSYRPRVRLHRQRRTITLPNPIRVDVTPPEVERFVVAPRVISPDGDLRGDSAVASYRVSEPSEVSLYVDGGREIRKRGLRPEGEIRWFGTIDGKPAPRGTHVLQLGAVDVAGNVAQRSAPARVLVRYVALGRERIEAVAGRRFAVLVVSDAPRIRWRLGGRAGVARPGTLRLRAPDEPGTYALVVTTPSGRADRAVVVVRAPEVGP